MPQSEFDPTAADIEAFHRDRRSADLSNEVFGWLWRGIKNRDGTPGQWNFYLGADNPGVLGAFPVSLYLKPIPQPCPGKGAPLVSGR